MKRKLRIFIRIMLWITVLGIVPHKEIVKASDDSPIEIEYNKYYEASVLEKWLETFRRYDYDISVDFPGPGRAKILVKNCTRRLAYEWTCSDKTFGYNCRRWKEEGVEDCDSGWITVNGGKATFSFETWTGYQNLNAEAEVMIQYQSIDQYNGEVGINNTFDTAVLMKNNITYEGTYNREGYGDTDIDIYKFYLEKPALVQLEYGKGSIHTIYEEGKYGNTSELEIPDRARLSAGYYYIKLSAPEEYTIRANVTYESPDEYEQENNNVKSQANKKQVNCWYTGNLNNEDDIDCYEITLPQKGKVFLELKVPREKVNAETLEILLCNKNGDILDSAKNTENPYFETDPVERTKDTYYVYVRKTGYYSAYTGDYSFRLHFEPIIRNKITYKLNGGRNNSGNPSIYTGRAITLKAPFKRGYVFKGWFTDSKYQKQIKRIVEKNDKAIVVYAKWEKVKVGKPVILSLRRRNSSQAVIKIRTIKGIRGYEITYSTDRGFKKNRKTVVTKKSTTIIKKLQKGKTYYVRVRAYKIDSTNQKVYSKYSTTKKVYIK